MRLGIRQSRIENATELDPSQSRAFPLHSTSFLPNNLLLSRLGLGQLHGANQIRHVDPSCESTAGLTTEARKNCTRYGNLQAFSRVLGLLCHARSAVADW